MTKLDDLYAADAFSARDVLYITKLWEDEPKLAKQVMRAIKDGENYDPAAQKAIINEWDSAVKYFTDLAPVAQNFILENSEDLAADLAVMIKKSPTYSKLSGNFWEYLAENYSKLPRAVRTELADREDMTRSFKQACGAVAPRAARHDAPAPRKSSREKVSDSDAPVKKSRTIKVSDSDSPAPRKSSRARVSDSDVPVRESRHQLSRSHDSDVPTQKRSVKEIMRKTNRPGKMLK